MGSNSFLINVSAANYKAQTITQNGHTHPRSRGSHDESCCARSNEINMATNVMQLNVMYTLYKEREGIHSGTISSSSLLGLFILATNSQFTLLICSARPRKLWTRLKQSMRERCTVYGKEIDRARKRERVGCTASGKAAVKIIF